MTEAKFLFIGVHKRNGWNLPDVLAYMAETGNEALAKCQKLNPDFEIHRWDLADHLV